ncbi:MAG: hypothetical protein AAB267_04935, partial [Candidatus Desantisbacteria bacterium]
DIRGIIPQGDRAELEAKRLWQADRIRLDQRLRQQNGPLNVVVDGDAYKTARVLSEFFFDEARIMREFYRGNVHFEHTGRDGRTETFSKSIKDNETIREKAWYKEGKYRIIADKDFEESNIKKGNTIDVVERLQNANRVFFYDSTSPEQRLISEAEVGLRQLDLSKIGTYRTFILPENIDINTIDKAKLTTLKGILSVGGKEVISGRNALLARQQTAVLFDSKAGTNRLEVEKMLSYARGELTIKLPGFELKGRAFAIKMRQYDSYPTWLCYKDSQDNKFKVVVYDSSSKTFKHDPQAVYNDEYEALEAIDNVSKLKLEDSWYDALTLGVNRPAKIVDKNTGDEIRFGIDVLEFAVKESEQQYNLLMSEQRIAAFGGQGVPRDISMHAGQRTVAEQVQAIEYEGVLKGWGGYRQGNIRFSGAKDLPLNVRVESEKKDTAKDRRETRNYIDTLGDNDPSNDRPFAYGEEALKYRAAMLKSMYDNMNNTLEGYRSGMVIETDKSAEIDTVHKGQAK